MLKTYFYIIVFIFYVTCFFFIFRYNISCNKGRRYSQVVRLWIANPSSPSSSLGAAFKMGTWWNGRHNRLKICRLIPVVRVQVPLSPILFLIIFKKLCIDSKFSFNGYLSCSNDFNNFIIS